MDQKLTGLKDSHRTEKNLTGCRTSAMTHILPNVALSKGNNENLVNSDEAAECVFCGMKISLVDLDVHERNCASKSWGMPKLGKLSLKDECRFCRKEVIDMPIHNCPEKQLYEFQQDEKRRFSMGKNVKRNIKPNVGTRQKIIGDNRVPEKHDNTKSPCNIGVWDSSVCSRKSETHRSPPTSKSFGCSFWNSAPTNRTDARHDTEVDQGISQLICKPDSTVTGWEPSVVPSSESDETSNLHNHPSTDADTQDFIDQEGQSDDELTISDEMKDVDVPCEFCRIVLPSAIIYDHERRCYANTNRSNPL